MILITGKCGFDTSTNGRQYKIVPQPDSAMSKTDSHPDLLLDMSFDDLEAMVETVYGWNLEFLQLECGVFRGRARQWRKCAHEGPTSGCPC